MSDAEIIVRTSACRILHFFRFFTKLKPRSGLIMITITREG